MNVLFISSSFPRPEAPTHCPYNLALCRALAKEHDLKALIPIPWTSAWRTRTSPPTGDLDVRYFTYAYLPGIAWFHDRWMYEAVRRAYRRVDHFVPEWLFSYWTYPDAAAALLLARELGRPLVAMVGGSDVLLAAKGSAAWRRAARTLTAADHVVTVSEDLSAHITAMGVPKSRVTVIPTGVDLSQFSWGSSPQARELLGIPADGPIAVWVGRLVPVKNLEALLRAARRLYSSERRFRLYLVGDGPLRVTLEALILRLKLADCVRLVSAVHQWDLVHWYRAADVVVLPSLSEGTPNTLMEAIACGKPFLASSVGGIPALADASIDVLVDDPRDERALARALETALFDRRGVERRPTSAVYTWEDVAGVVSQCARRALSHA